MLAAPLRGRLALAACLAAAAPVSYTHLDVYKRQSQQKAGYPPAFFCI